MTQVNCSGLWEEPDHAEDSSHEVDGAEATGHKEDAPLSENGFGCICVECMGKPLLQKQELLIHLLTGSFLTAEKRLGDQG